jgi:hypothetical protein
MNPQSLIETLLDIVFFLRNWRFTVCFVGGIALAIVAFDRIAAEPLRWIVAGGIVLAGMIIGKRWDDYQG